MIEVARPWSEIDPTKKNPISNLQNQKYLKFLNTRVFSEEALHFLHNGYYCAAPEGTKDYEDYWDEQEKRILNGYEVGGVRITGRHYYALNFGMMEARPLDLKTGKENLHAKKIKTFPRFLDHQYYLAHELEECLAEGQYVNTPMQGMIIAKSRRKGLTYFCSNLLYGYNFNFIQDSKNYIFAYEEMHYRTLLDGVHMGLNHINEHTPWAKRRQKKNERDWFRASYLEKNEKGMEIEKGYMSEIQCLSVGKSEFKPIGTSATIVGFEESGRNKILLKTFIISETTWKDGNIMTGIPIIWGTGGDMSSGTQDFCEIFDNPKTYGLKAYDNTYEDNATGECGYFIDDMWYCPGEYIDKVTKEKHLLVDEHGNSYRELAEIVLDEERKLKKKGTASSYQSFLTQRPKKPSEAFLRVEGSRFDVAQLQDRLNEIIIDKKTFLDSIYVVDLKYREDGSVYHEYSDNQPIREFPLKQDQDKVGAIEIYEMPAFNKEGDISAGIYIAATDPFEDDGTTFSKSLGSTFVMNVYTQRIVAEYTARPLMTATYFENVRKLLKFYNATCNYEKTRKGMFAYFDKMNCAYMLADTPEYLRDQLITTISTTGNNSKGTPMTGPIKSHGLDLIQNYLLSQAYDRSEGICNINTLRSLGLIKELIAYQNEGNFDRVMAFIMLMIYNESVSKFRRNEKVAINDIANDKFFVDNNQIFNNMQKMRLF